ncbi:MAG: hypothetical protein RL154_1449 [Pseudomonadota bacterium]|jgi:general secretion pathway protein G
MKNARSGFTLIEIMIVVVILGLLAALIAPNVIGKGEEAKVKIACTQMKSISEAMQLFKADNGSYPTTNEGIAALQKNPNAENYKNYSPSGYLSGKNLPKDPWKNEYFYANDSGNISIKSSGGDLRDDAKAIYLDKQCQN